MDNKYNYIVSGVIAISLYILIILVFILYLINPAVKTYQAISNETIIQLDIISEKTKDDKETKKPKEQIKKVIKDVKVEEASSASANKKTNLKSLFANVSTKASKIQEKKVLNLKKNETSSRFKSKFEKNKSRSEIKISKLDNSKSVKTNKKLTITNNKGNFNEYYSKVNTIILNRWYLYPLLATQSYLVQVEVEITTKGVFSYTILKYSGNLNIDNSVKDFLNTQINEVYPLPIDGKNKNILINFINEKEE